MALAPETVLEAERVTAGYGDLQILKQASIKVDNCEIVVIIGPNGSGKSTLLKAVFGLVRPTSGSIRHRGEDITSNPAEQNVVRGIAYVPQTDNIFPGLTIEDNLKVGCYRRPTDFARSSEHVYTLFPLLAERRSEAAGALSGGQRQMLAIGRAMMMHPSVILLDEPSAGLSPKMTDYVFERIRAFPDAGMSVLLVEQNVNVALAISDRVYVFAAGREHLSGSPEEIQGNEEVRRLYLGG